jgi:hypothetical protein
VSGFEILKVTPVVKKRYGGDFQARTPTQKKQNKLRSDFTGSVANVFCLESRSLTVSMLPVGTGNLEQSFV